MMIKKCTKCNKEFPTTKEYFNLNKRHTDGLASRCRKCHVIATLSSRRKNMEKHRNYDKKYCKTLKGYICHLINSIKQRCNNSKANNYLWYGGRGIKCLLDGVSLYSWIIKNGVEPRGRDIHRINPNGDYSLDNIEFLDHNLHLSLHADLRK